MRAAVLEAFPPGVLDAECRAALAVPFLLDPVRALCGLGPVRGRVVHDCARLVAMFVHGVACSVCGEPACGVARSALPSLSVPFPSQVRRLLPPVRSAAQDSWMASCDLLDGVCVCDQSALGAASQGAEADAREGRARFPIFSKLPHLGFVLVHVVSRQPHLCVGVGQNDVPAFFPACHFTAVS